MMEVDPVALLQAAQQTGEGAGGGPSLNVVWDTLIKSGPVAVILGLVLYFVNKDRLRLIEENKEIQRRHEECLRSTDEDGKALLAQVLRALGESKRAIDGGASVIETVRHSLNTIITFMQTRADASDRRDKERRDRS